MTQLNPVSRKYAGVRLAGSLILWTILLLAFAVMGIIGLVLDITPLAIISFALMVPLLIGAIIEIIVVVRQVRALGYLEREHDLLLQRGIMFRATTVVPYGRLQYVEVTAGPLMRAARVAMLARAAALAGALLTAWYLGGAVYLLISVMGLRTEAAMGMLAASVSAAILMAVGLIVESFCSLPPDDPRALDDDSPHRSRRTDPPEAPA